MENCNSRSNSKTRKGPDSGGKFPPDRAPLYSRQSSRENHIKRLYHHVDENNILIPEQHGFRPDLSTTHQLLRVVETIKSGFKKIKIDWCGFPRYSKSLRSRLARRPNFQINQI
ncbi:hypothetical protein TNCV_3791101 [Trichonephila clavipes]|nr:hypothetical protein TNCV_3791101 [Trichonephila clavipes]